MKKWFLSLLIYVSVFASALCLTVYAGNRAKAVSFTLGEGYEYFDSKRHIRNTNFYFGALDYNFTYHWGFEVFLARLETKFKRSLNDNQQVNGTLFAMDGVYHFSPYKFIEPFVLAGVGITGLNPNRTSPNNESNINAGLGSQFFVNPSVALRIEARDFYSIIESKNDFLLDAGISLLFDL